ncbi:MAG: TraB family protein [Methanocella sp. PtaU1.Bin125]|nr:MAG: TraB family protein [Methanocella sp. PtaU1.Bin125]
MKDSPLIVRPLEDSSILFLGSVHTLSRNVPRILDEIGRFSPDFIAIELSVPGRITGSQDVDAVSARYGDRLVCLDRPPEVTSLRYLSDTPPPQYLKESLIKYAWLPFNQASIVSYNYLHGLYRALLDDRFYTFGWSMEDRRRFIFERDEYMAGKLIEHMRMRRDQGFRDRYVVLVGRRHVAGMTAVVDAYRVTGDVGSYYAGGRVFDAFSLHELENPYTVDRSTAEYNNLRNRVIETLASTIFLPVYMLSIFLALACAMTLIAVAILRLTTG